MAHNLSRQWKPYPCANSLKTEWLGCGHWTLKLPHPLRDEETEQDCRRTDNCSTQVLVKDIFPGKKFSQKCPSCDASTNTQMLFYSYDPDTEEVRKLDVVDGKPRVIVKKHELIDGEWKLVDEAIKVNFKRVWLLHCEDPGLQ